MIVKLTPREKEALQQLYDCEDDRDEILFRMCIEMTTLKSLLKRVYSTLGVNKASAAICAGIKLGLITIENKDKRQE